MNKCRKKLLRKTFSITIFIPLLIIMIISFDGITLTDALKNSIHSVLNIHFAFFSWILIITMNIIIFFILKPVSSFWYKYKNNIETTMVEKNRAMSVLNSIGKKISIMNVIIFVSGIVTTSSFKYFYVYGDFLSRTYLFMDSLTTGLFTSILIVMSLENVFFPIKSALMMNNTIIKPKYQSYYKRMNFTILLLLTFLVFQVFAITTKFYEISSFRSSGLHRMIPSPEMNLSPEMMLSKSGRSYIEITQLLNVFGIKIIMYFILSIRILFLLKKKIKNPLDIVEERLEKLTSGSKTVTNEIAIVENNEFSTIYADINKLIIRQRSELETSKQRLHTIIDSAADAIVSFDNNGHIFIFNPAAEKLFGWHQKEVLGSPFSKLFDQNEDYCKKCGEDTAMFVQVVTAKDNKLHRYSGKTKEGKKITFESSFSQSSTPNGIIHTAIIRDIYKQLLFEESLKNAKLSAERANGLKSEFLANMSHELRTPLNAVLGFTQLLNTDKNLTDSQVEKLNIISRSGEHLLGLINDILDISKIEAGKIELHESTFNLREFTEDLKQMLDLKCKTKGLTLYVEYVDPLPKFVKSDLGKLRQIMINILGNAIKFTSEGGIAVVVGIENDKLKFSVNDTGKGIPDDEIDSILQPFTQSSITDNEGGTGLGLAITNSFIQMMGGQLEIESKEDVGSTFSFSVDYEQANESEEVQEEFGTVLGIEDDRHPTVIIVDDKINNRLILKEMLERVGFVTIEAENGLEALERTKEFKPEIVFMDIKMPVMDGYEAVKLIKADESIKNIPVFALTASAFKHDEKSILKSGFNGFIAKPFKLTSLFKLIHEKSDINFIYETVHSVKKEISIDDLNISQVSEALTSEQIDQIDDLALINDFVGIKNILEPLKEDSRLIDFVDTVIFLTDNFDDDNLLKLIQNIKDVG